MPAHSDHPDHLKLGGVEGILCRGPPQGLQWAPRRSCPPPRPAPAPARSSTALEGGGEGAILGGPPRSVSEL